MVRLDLGEVKHLNGCINATDFKEVSLTLQYEVVMLNSNSTDNLTDASIR